MGCGSGRPYSEKEVEKYIKKCQPRLQSAELTEDGRIKLKTTDGFFNASPLLDSTWLQGKITNNEYHQAIEHINHRIAQSVIGTSNNLSIEQIPKSQSAKLALEELNAKYEGRIHFTYEQNNVENSINTNESFIYISFK
ncbi:unnamed protein product [Rotaria sp. Silwood1]|nr:unnamed protein product [Rotaria sp. Silwood1]CAF1514006.1 unnamed protein product [Rotaria sp. Silwood1]CAF3710251.1 unnamed protein product [Rotaria sp. Silwood1]CAF3732463.1 unnamed protein product [Rotaria sp. Silwood1]CAF4825555.1 unnamed protein product [Rotaria sp. Silwood1]